MNTYRAGVLVLGSLLWDNSNGRKVWREHYFGENFQSQIIDIKVPTRYGRYSQGRKCPTVVLSSAYLRDQNFGTAKFIPFKNQKMNFQELICSARDLSEAEGSSSRGFVKGGTIKWCIITCLLSNNFDSEEKEHFLDKWADNYTDEITEEFVGIFKMDTEEESIISNKGNLKLKWSDSLSNFDLILATQTKPRKAIHDSSDYLNSTDLASQIFGKPEYFVKNKLNGISTPEDFEIIDVLKGKPTLELRENAINDGCLEIEIDNFIQNYL
jgi:hypothetical protein